MHIHNYNGNITTRFAAAPTNLGANLSLGFRPLDVLAIGAAVHYFNCGNLLSNLDSAGDIIEGNYFALDGGLVYEGFDGQLLFDLQVLLTNQAEQFVLLTEGRIDKGILPLLIESTLTGSFLNKTLFIACKGIGELYNDDLRSGYFLRLIPMVEYWPYSFLAVRGGYERALIDQAGKSGTGNGFLGGITCKLADFSLNVNYAYRTKPLHVLPGYQLSQHFVLFGLTYSPGFIKR